MKIKKYRHGEVDIQELANFIQQGRGEEMAARGMNLSDLEDRLENEWPFIGYVLARSEDKLVGYVLLYRIGDSDLIEINPGSVLGFHPYTAQGVDDGVVGTAMVNAAKEMVQEQGFNALYIDIPWGPAAPPETYAVYQKCFGAWGFEVIQQVRQMKITLPVEVPAPDLLPDVQFAQVQTVDEESLYQCHHQAYLAGDVHYYFQMDESERRDDFKRIYAPNIRAHPASLVLTLGDTILGYCLLFAEGDFSELMSLAVHPDHRRKGYGRALLIECLRRAGEAGLETMVLIVDEKNRKAGDLYSQAGFQDTGGNMTFKWKA